MALQDLTPQLRTRLHKVEWMVMSFLVGALLLIAGSVTWFIRATGEARGWWITQVPYYTYVAQGTGIKVGTPVQLMGFKVGQVTQVEPVNLDLRRSWDYYATNNFNVYVAFTVHEPYPGYIGTDSRVTIGGFPIEIAGGLTLDISVGSPNAVVTVTNLPGGKMGVLWDKFAYAPDSLDRTNKLLKYGPITNGNKGYYLAPDQSETLVAQAGRIMAKVDRVSGVIDLALPRMTNRIENLLARVDSIAQKVEPVIGQPGGIGSLLVPTNLNARLDTVLLDLHEQSERLVPTIAKVNRTLDTAQQTSAEVKPLLQQIQSTVVQVHETVKVLQAKVGETNLLYNVSRLANNAAQLSETTDYLFRHHWLFRSAFRTNSPSRPVPLRSESVRDRR